MKSKNLVVFVLFTLFSFNAKAQLGVGETVQLERLNQSMLTLIQLVSQNNATASANKMESLESKLINKDNLKVVKDAESLLWKVDMVLKKGQEINRILDREASIIASIKNLQQVTSSNGMKPYRNVFMNLAYDYLTNAGKNVDLALNMVSDGYTRMDTTARRDILKDIDANLAIIESQIGQLSSKAQSFNIQNANDDYYKKVREQTQKELKSRP